MIYDMKADCSDVCFIVRISLSHTLIFFLQEYWSKEVSMFSLKSLWLHKFSQVLNFRKKCDGLDSHCRTKHLPNCLY